MIVGSSFHRLVSNTVMDHSRQPRVAIPEETVALRAHRGRLWKFDLRAFCLLICGSLLAAGGVRQGHAQEAHLAQPARFLKANDSFGMELLRETHRDLRGQNIALSPLPISLAFAVLVNGGADPDSAREIEDTFHWAGNDGAPSAKMLLRRV